MGADWGALGPLWGSTGVLWAPCVYRLGCSGDPMGVDWGALGNLWGSTGVLWGPCGGQLGCSGGPMGVDWGSTGVLWGPYGGRFGCSGDPMGVDWGALGVDCTTRIYSGAPGKQNYQYYKLPYLSSSVSCSVHRLRIQRNYNKNITDNGQPRSTYNIERGSLIVTPLIDSASSAVGSLIGVGQARDHARVPGQDRDRAREIRNLLGRMVARDHVQENKAHHNPQRASGNGGHLHLGSNPNTWGLGNAPTPWWGSGPVEPKRS